MSIRYKKFISIVLCICLVLSAVCVPSVVYSEDMKDTIASGDVSVSAVLSPDAVLTAVRLEDPFAQPAKRTKSVRSSAPSIQDLPDVSFRAFYDIKLENSEGSGFEVTISGLDLSAVAEGRGIRILHIFDSEEVIKSALEEGSAFPISDGSFISAFPDEAQISEQCCGEPCVFAEYIIPDKITSESVTFTTDSFSVFVVVDAPEPAVSGWVKLTSPADIIKYGSNGILICHTNEYYFTDVLERNVGGNSRRTGIRKTAKITSPAAAEAGGAALYFFEPVGDSSDTFYVYCQNGGTQYIQQNGNSLLFVDSKAQATAFTASTLDGVDGVLLFGSPDGWYWNMQGGNGGKAFAAYNTGVTTDVNFRFCLYTYVVLTDDDPYGLDGKTYGLISDRDGISGIAMLAREKQVEKNGTVRNVLDGQYTLVRSDPINKVDILYVAQDSDITMWTFRNVEKDLYYLTAEVDGSTKYVRVLGSDITLADEPDEYCVLQALPGEGQYAHKIRFLGVSNAINYSANSAGFGGYNDAGPNEYLYLADRSVYTEEDFVSYSARKISVSEAVNGSQVVIYTRVWDEATKTYGYYLIDHNGDLIRGYESGDDIVWTGTKINTVPYTFTEYYYEGTTDPNYYFDLQNIYSEKYLAPQIEDGRVFSDERPGINLNGRRYGDYYTTILMWDDPHYDYAGLKAENGKIVSAPMSQASEFYFAQVHTSDVLHTVETVDHTQYGVTVKLVDFDGNSLQNQVLGNSSGTSGTPAHKGLLSDGFGEDGYPVATFSDQSIAALFAEAQEVNHLFLESTYYGSGYYEFDSLQNFASLQSDGNFKVYQELGTIEIEHGTTLDHGQFMPFNDLTPGLFSEKHPFNLRDALNNMLPSTDPRMGERLYSIPGDEANYYFGVEIEASFVQPDSGKDAWGHDIIFEFTGDDDFWLYVDGELVIDLGGVHGALPGSVNFSTGQVVVEGKSTTLYNIYKAHYIAREGVAENDPSVAEYLNGIFEVKDGNYVFRDFTTHKMRIFFMERGAGASNLRMRFNLAAVNPDEVHLTKEISGTDKYDYSSSRFPFQILYRMDGVEYLLEPNVPTNTVSVKYLNSNEDVEFLRSYTTGGASYSNVFFLKPGQTAAIRFPEGIDDYRIVECAVSTDIYDQVKVNGTEVSGTAAGSGIKDFASSWASIEDRTKITFNNHVDQDSLRSLVITKMLYDAAGNFITAEEDPTGFLFRIYLGEDLEYYRAGEYHVKDPAGNYCYYSNGFISLGKTEFSQLTDDEKASATFKTSFSGAADKIPSGYSIEIRDLLVGTKFKVVENDYDTPTGYGLRTFTEEHDGVVTTYVGYKRVEGSYIVEDGDTQNSGVIRDNSNPRIEIHNQRGFGLRVEKEWSDADFMLSHEDIHVAVFIRGEMLEGSVHTIDSYNYTTYYFDSLLEGASFDDYEVKEVVQTASGWAAADSVEVSGKDKNGNDAGPYTYTVVVEKGDFVSSYGGDPNIRIDTVRNIRAGGFEIRKTDMEGNALAGAEFTIAGEDGNIVGTYVSDADGNVTAAYLDPGTYTLTETRSPSGYVALPDPVIIVAAGSGVSVSGGTEGYFEFDESTAIPVLTVKNKPFTLRVVKKDADSSAPVEGAVFALYRQVQGYKDYHPMDGFESLTTGSDGVVPEIDNTLRTGTFYLTEIQAPEGYRSASETKDLLFTISSGGVVSIAEGPDYSGTLTVTDGQITEYVITLTNKRTDTAVLTITKTYSDPLEADASSLFHVTGTDGRDLWIAIIGSDSVEITGCRPGETYTVSEETSWSWQYTPDEAEKSVVIDAEGSEVVFTNSVSRNDWLSDSAGAVNSPADLEH